MASFSFEIKYISDTAVWKVSSTFNHVIDMKGQENACIATTHPLNYIETRNVIILPDLVEKNEVDSHPLYDFSTTKFKSYSIDKIIIFLDFFFISESTIWLHIFHNHASFPLSSFTWTISTIMKHHLLACLAQARSLFLRFFVLLFSIILRDLLSTLYSSTSSSPWYRIPTLGFKCWSN